VILTEPEHYYLQATFALISKYVNEFNMELCCFKSLSCVVSRTARQHLCTAQSKYSLLKHTTYCTSTISPAPSQFTCRTVEPGSTLAANFLHTASSRFDAMIYRSVS